MQFIPSTWATYGVDANEDGRKDPYNPVDAICAAARYLRAAGGDKDLRRAIFAYNHADWYVDEVLLYANQYGKLPDALVGSLTGLTEGAHFPVAADARYADDINDAAVAGALHHRAPVRGQRRRRDQFERPPPKHQHLLEPQRSGGRGQRRGGQEDRRERRLGKYIVLQDAYGNRYTYAQLGSVAKLHPVPRQQALSAKDFKLTTPKKDAAPTQPASAGENSTGREGSRSTEAKPSRSRPRRTPRTLRDRLFALPQRPGNAERASITGQLDQLLGRSVPGYETFKSAFADTFQFDSKTDGAAPAQGRLQGHRRHRDRPRRRQPDGQAPHLNFAIRPAGRGAPTIDPKPILDGWKLLETTAIYRAAGQEPLRPTTPRSARSC